MFRIFIILGVAAAVVLGCTRRLESEESVIAVSLAPTYIGMQTSKAGVYAGFVPGDALGVYTVLEGREAVGARHTRFEATQDGTTFVGSPAVHYPDERNAVRIYAYYPYQPGASNPHAVPFEVAADQTDLRGSDLCWGSAVTTPVEAPVPLLFRHALSKIAVSVVPAPAEGATVRLEWPEALCGGTLDVQNGLFSVGAARKTLETSGGELIAPAQGLARLVVEVEGVEYVFVPTSAVALAPGWATGLSLTLNAESKTAELAAEPTVAPWISGVGNGAVAGRVSNRLTSYWLPMPERMGEANKVVLTVRDEVRGVLREYEGTDLSVVGDRLEFTFLNDTLGYPYSIEEARLYKGTEFLVGSAEVKGGRVYKSGGYTFGVSTRLPGQYIVVNGLNWACGNLVATGDRGAGGEGACEIGDPTDGGLYFQFGSLIGWKGGNQTNGGNGVGMPQAPLTTNGTYWNGQTTSWPGFGTDAYLWPTEMGANPTGVTAWPSGATTNQWYFGLQTGWSTAGQNIREYPGFTAGTLANVGVGDPCTYYLGGTWRTATTTELAALSAKTGSSAIAWGTAGVTGRWATSTETFGGVSGPGAWFGPGLSAGVGTPDIAKNLFFPASGYRDYSTGSFYTVGSNGGYWSSSVSNATFGHALGFYTMSIHPQSNNGRSGGFPVRCVAEVVDVKSWWEPSTNAASKTVNVFVPAGQPWTASVVSGAGLTVSDGSGAGSGSFTMSYALTTANTGRTGMVRVTVGPSTFTIPTAQGRNPITTPAAADHVRIGALNWAKGNLVAISSTAGGTNGCKIGDPTDAGLYFQFGSLIGYKGGHSSNNGTGQGVPSYVSNFWGGAMSFSWANDAMVWPTSMFVTPTTWPNNIGSLEGDRTDFSDYFFTYNAAPYSTANQNIRNCAASVPGDTGVGTLATGRYASKGIGDPCTYYLGGTWRLPTAAEYLMLFDNVANNTVWGSVPNWSWTTSTFNGAQRTGNEPYFPASGFRSSTSSSFNDITSTCYGWSSSTLSSTHGYSLLAGSVYVNPRSSNSRVSAFPVRCVMD